MRNNIVAVLIFAFLSNVLTVRATAQTRDSVLISGFRKLAEFDTSLSPSDARSAYQLFTRLLRTDPSDPDAHLGLGLTYAAVEGWSLEQPGVGGATSLTNNTLALQHLFIALRGSSDRARAANAIMKVALREYDRNRIVSAVHALEKAGGEPGVRLAIAQLDIALYDPRRASEVLSGETSSAAKRLLGISHLLQHTTVAEGGTEYLQSLQDADSMTLLQFVRDARWVADSIEAASWKHMNLDELKGRLVLFWSRRAMKAGVSISDRLALHFVRVQRASDQFNYYRQRLGVPGPMSVSPQIDGREFDVDDRAFVYVRYGEPDHRISTRDSVPTAPQSLNGNCKRPRRPGEAPECPVDLARQYVTYPFNETWVYNRLAAHPVSFDFFLMPGDPHGWTLVTDVVRCGSQGSLPYSEAYLRDRMSLDPRYGTILTECGSRASPPDLTRLQFIALPFVQERLEFLQKAVQSDNARQSPRIEIPLAIDLLQFAGTNHLTEITALMMFPLGTLQRRHGTVAAHAEFTIYDTLSGRATVKDTTIMVSAASLPAQATARVYLRTYVSSGNGQSYRVKVEDLNAVEVFGATDGAVRIRDFDRRPSISDVALVSNQLGSWTRGQITLSLLPASAKVRKFGIYYEVYGLPTRSEYQTTLTFQPKDASLTEILLKTKGRGTVTVNFSGQNTSEDSIFRALRTIDTELPAGHYSLVVTVHVAGGQLRAERDILLRPETDTNR